MPASTPNVPQVRGPAELQAMDDRALVLTIAAVRLDLNAWLRQIATATLAT